MGAFGVGRGELRAVFFAGHDRYFIGRVTPGILLSTPRSVVPSPPDKRSQPIPLIIHWGLRSYPQPLALPAGCLVGWLMGSWADRHWHQGWIGVAGIVLGAVAGFLQIVRTAMRFLKNGR